MSFERRYLKKVQLQLMLRKKWSYLRYLYLRKGFQEALTMEGDIKSFVSVGCGSGLAEIALALEFPTTQFHLTDIGNLKDLRNKLGIRMAQEWQISNVTFDVFNVLSKPSKTYDFVASVEVLEHIEDDKKAANNMVKMSENYVFSLVPFASLEENLDPKLKETVFRNHQHYRVGYNLASLSNLFPGSSIIKNCYFQKEGFQFRQKLDVLTNREIEDSLHKLQEMAERDLSDKNSQDPDNKNYGIWILAKPQ